MNPDPAATFEQADIHHALRPAPRRRIVRTGIGLILALSGVGILVTPGIARAQDGRPRIDADGTLHVRELTIPPSGLWSPEFQDFYARTMANALEPPEVQMPARDAPKTEWDEYDAWNDGFFAEPLAWVLERYPVHVADTTVAGVRVGIITPEIGIAPENEHRVLINLRGGGFVANRGLSFGLLESIPVAAIGRTRVITVDYRQAPFHGYPAATEDVEAVYRELLEQHEPEAIGIYGCSAGGALTAQSVAWFQAEGLPRPGAVGIFCSAPAAPWARGSGDSGIWLSPVPKSELSQADQAAWAPAGWYMESADRNDPKAYPGSSDAVLAKFPPTLFLSGTRDFAMSAAIVAHARFLKLGVDASLYIMEGAPHAAHVLAVDTPEAHDAYAYIARWFEEHLAR